MTRKFFFIILFIFIKANCIAQLVDTTLVNYHYYKNHTQQETRLNYLIGTTGGAKVLYQDWFSGSMVNSYTYSYFFTKTITSFDSVNSIKINTAIKKNTGSWINVSRNLVYYDNFGRVTDSLYQVWNNSSWLDTSKFSCVYNSFDSLNYFENLKWNGSQFENKNRTEYYYSSTHKDSLILTFQGNLQNWIPVNRTIYSYDISDSLTLILTQIWDGSTWKDSIQETFTYNFLPDSSESIKQEWVNLNWLNKTRTIYFYSGNSIDSAYVYLTDTNGIFLTARSYIYKYYAGKSFSRSYSGGFYNYSYDSTDFYGRLIYYDGTSYNLGYPIETILTYNYSINGKLFFSSSHVRSILQPGHDQYDTLYSFDPLVNYFPLQTIVDCQSDTLLIASDVSGTLPPYTYQWTSTAYIDSPSAPNINVATIANTKYYLTIRDTLGNVFHDSVYVGKIYHAFLGADINTTVGSSITLDAGMGCTSYLWQDSSTNQFLTITSLDTTIITAYVFVTDSNGCSGSDTINIAFYVNGIDDLKKDMIVVSPNPAMDHLKINSTVTGDIKIYDSIGRIYFSMHTDPGIQQISLKKIPRGIYFLEISSEKGHQIKKIILQ